MILWRVMTSLTNNSQQTFLPEPLWHGQLAVVAAIVLQIALPDRYLVAPRYVVILLEIILLIALVITSPKDVIFKSIARRFNAVVLIALISFANIFALLQVAQQLLGGGRAATGSELILISLNIYITNIIIFGLWYWEIDGGGPGTRLGVHPREHDFLFPQMTSSDVSPQNWRPSFVDYLYVSSTNATAFSPTDTMPMTHRAKLLMGVQAIVSLVTVALVAARAVNILN
jgi:hypothetical protein